MFLSPPVELRLERSVETALEYFKQRPNAAVKIKESIQLFLDTLP